MKRALVAVALVLVGCGTGPMNPIVDMQNVDPVKYNRDLAECNHAPGVIGNPISRCMRKKGYKILESYDAWE
jgi:hypothetical protein